MTAPIKLAAFAAVLVLVLGLGLLAGSVFGPIDTGSEMQNHGGS